MMNMQPYEKEHLKTLRASLAECTVLLKNNGDFPLPSAGKIALYGSGARHTVVGGTGSGEVNSRFTVSVEQGLEDAGFTITTKAWLDAYDTILEDAHKQFIRDIKAQAKKNHTNVMLEGMGVVMPEPEYELALDGDGDAAVYVLARISGEGNDRKPIPGDVLLTETETRDILSLQKKYKKFLLTLNVGGPVDLSPVADVENILILSQLGVETGSVLADILTGAANPSGKLTTTWSTWTDYPSIGDFGDKNDNRYREGIYVGYRYFDSVGKTPMFPFGYGLSFTEFAISHADARRDGETITATAKVKNTGRRTGKETVQLYVSAPSGKHDQPYQVLAGFAKTKELAPGAAEQISISFCLRDLASFSSADNAYILEAGSYVLRIGSSSVETVPFAAISVDSDILVRKVHSCFGETDFADWKPEHVRNETLPENLPVISLTAGDIPEETVSYDNAPKIESEIKALSDEELIYLNIGSFDPKGGIASIIGSAGRSVAGAAGETTDVLKAKGIDALVMADGPAGLRISQKYFIDKDGIHSMGAVIPETIAAFMPVPLLFITNLMAKKPKKDSEIYYQFATAIPIGTALAQSWNLDFVTSCGDLVGEEMERFGIHLWLAPALNIHRSILCGRNFEYYSEDPVVSGQMAAAITKGVQKHPSCGTTIKHFAANNQEYNRYTNNSVVSQRALRELYLRGFEICIRESQPHALMTSYNLINGVHASEREDLVEDVLRHEFGFKGIAMTDWTIAGTSGKNPVHPEARADKIAAAGVDLVMPGSTTDYKNIQAALKDGSLKRDLLERNASRVLRMIRKLHQ